MKIHFKKIFKGLIKFIIIFISIIVFLSVLTNFRIERRKARTTEVAKEIVEKYGIKKPLQEHKPIDRTVDSLLTDYDAHADYYNLVEVVKDSSSGAALAIDIIENENHAAFADDDTFDKIMRVITRTSNAFEAFMANFVPPDSYDDTIPNNVLNRIVDTFDASDEYDIFLEATLTYFSIADEDIDLFASLRFFIPLYEFAKKITDIE